MIIEIIVLVGPPFLLFAFIDHHFGCCLGGGILRNFWSCPFCWVDWIKEKLLNVSEKEGKQPKKAES